MGKARWVAAGGVTVILCGLALPGMLEQARGHGLAAAAAPEPVTTASASDQPPPDTPAPGSASVAVLASASAAPAGPAVAETPAPQATAQPAPAPRDENRGSVTSLPLPRFVSLKTGEGNARRGPGLTHRIDWVFTRAGMPLRITAEYEHWRRVEDAEGAGGWVHYSLLSGVRSVLVLRDMAEFRQLPDPNADVLFQAEMGVIGKVVECRGGWCRVSVDGDKGWVEEAALWGVDPGEQIE